MGESLPLDIDRRSPNTMRNSIWRRLGHADTGVITNYSIGQSKFMWFLRLLPRVREAFATAWGLPVGAADANHGPSGNIAELMTSFDGCGAQRNIFLPGAENTWRTKAGWFHTDQNHKFKSGFHSLQGVLNFYPVDELSGSTVLVLGSHLRFEEVCASHPEARGNFVKIVETRQPAQSLVKSAVQAILDPGDLLLFDSRVVHCNQVLSQACHSPSNTIALQDRPDAALSRLVAYISMAPAKKIPVSSADARHAFVKEGRTSGHDVWCMPLRKKYAEVDPAYVEPSPSDPLWQLVTPAQ